jgi:cold shock CspA family protein
MGEFRRFLQKKTTGFIATLDEGEIYFHRDIVIDNAFDRLNVGSEVRFAEEFGEKGVQASTVQPMGEHHLSEHVSGPYGRNTGGQHLSLRQMIVAAVAAVSADADPRRRACLSMSGRASLNTIGHAAVVGGSGVPRLLFHWDPSQSMLQNESRGYGVI